MAKDSFGRGRIEAFSDGVIAIIVTIMVLELHLPENALEGDLWAHLILPLAPKLASYAMSFLVVAIMWVNHHAMLDTVHRVNRSILWWNLLLLFFMSLIPLVTGFWGEHPLETPSVAAYGAVLALNSITFTLFRRHLMLNEHENQALAAHHARVFHKSLLGAALYTASAGLAFLSPWISIAIFVAIPLMFFLPETGEERD